MPQGQLLMILSGLPRQPSVGRIEVVQCSGRVGERESDNGR